MEEFAELMGKCGIIMEDEKGRYGAESMLVRRGREWEEERRWRE